MSLKAFFVPDGSLPDPQIFQPPGREFCAQVAGAAGAASSQGRSTAWRRGEECAGGADGYGKAWAWKKPYYIMIIKYTFIYLYLYVYMWWKSLVFCLFPTCQAQWKISQNMEVSMPHSFVNGGFSSTPCLIIRGHTHVVVGYSLVIQHSPRKKLTISKCKSDIGLYFWN